MKKHIYLHTSNLNYKRDIKDDRNFEPCIHYSVKDYQKISKYEFGRINTNENYIHIIMGNIPQENCPWCGSIPKLIKLPDEEIRDILLPSKYCIQCYTCGSRGPVLNVNCTSEQNSPYMEEMENLIKRRYERRNQWDHDFINPYDSIKEAE